MRSETEGLSFFVYSLGWKPLADPEFSDEILSAGGAFSCKAVEIERVDGRLPKVIRPQLSP